MESTHKACYLYIPTLNHQKHLRLQGAYYIWVDKNNFKSMLPADRKAKKEARAAECKLQGMLDSHLTECPPPTHVVKYSHVAFKQAAIEWLSATDQVSFSFDYFAGIV
jgi:hypothetical protein